MKKWSALLLAMLMAFTLLAGCSGQSGTGGANQQGGQETLDPSSDTAWYELEPDSGMLTIRLPDEEQGFTWAFSIADESILELLTHETTEKQGRT